MIHQPPAGARDLLPLEVAQKAWINDRIQEVFQRWGYQRIVTSTLEWLDTLMAGGAIERSTVIKLQDSSEGSLGLRPELTASIARAAVTRMAGNTFPQRLCYRANVFRNPPSGYPGRQVEFYQAGVELLFAGGVLADAEILLLVTDTLQTLGLDNWYLLLGDAGLTRSLLAPFPDPLQRKVRHCIANLDRITLENLPLSPEQKERALLLFQLRGKPRDVLPKIINLDLDSKARDSVNNLKALIELLDQTLPPSLPLILDLSLIQTFDYYTGLVFAAVSYREQQSHILGQGGRYDQLLGIYHPQGETAPGIGFSLNLEDLQACLLNSEHLPQQAPTNDCLVIPKTVDAQAATLIYAQQLRVSNPYLRVEIDLGGREPEQIKEYARSCRISQLVWLDNQGNAVIEQL